MKNKEHSDLIKQLKYWQSQHKHTVCEISLLKESEWSILENDYEYKFYQRINAQIGEFRYYIHLIESKIREIKQEIKYCQRNFRKREE